MYGGSFHIEAKLIFNLGSLQAGASIRYIYLPCLSSHLSPVVCVEKGFIYNVHIPLFGVVCLDGCASFQRMHSNPK